MRHSVCEVSPKASAILNRAFDGGLVMELVLDIHLNRVVIPGALLPVPVPEYLPPGSLGDHGNQLNLNSNN